MKIKKFNESYTGRLTVKDLKSRLDKFDDNLEVMILDGFNGGGNPRRINIGPLKAEIGPDDIDSCSDCHIYNVGDEYVQIGFGSY